MIDAGCFLFLILAHYLIKSSGNVSYKFMFAFSFGYILLVPAPQRRKQALACCNNAAIAQQIAENTLLSELQTLHMLQCFFYYKLNIILTMLFISCFEEMSTVLLALVGTTNRHCNKPE